MDCTEEIVDPRIPDAEAAKIGIKNAERGRFRAILYMKSAAESGCA